MKIKIRESEAHYLWELTGHTPAFDQTNTASYRWKTPYGILSDHLKQKGVAYSLEVDDEAGYAMYLLARGHHAE